MKNIHEYEEFLNEDRSKLSRRQLKKIVTFYIDEFEDVEKKDRPTVFDFNRYIGDRIEDDAADVLDNVGFKVDDEVSSSILKQMKDAVKDGYVKFVKKNL